MISYDMLNIIQAAVVMMCTMLHDRGRDDGLHDRGHGLHDHDDGHGDGLHGHDHDRDHYDAHQGFPLPHHLLSPYCVFL